MSNEPIKGLFPALYDLCECKTVSVAEMGEWRASSWSWCWEKLGREAAGEVGLVTELKTLLTGIVPEENAPDRWIWLLDSVRGFSVKSCYAWITDMTSRSEDIVGEEMLDACRGIWKNDIPSKARIFTWRLLMGRIATKLELSKRGILQSHNDLRCVFCYSEEETISHLFSSCVVTREVWEAVSEWLGLSITFDSSIMQNFLQFGQHFCGKRRRKARHLIWIAVVWCIWRARNNILFRGEVYSARKIILSTKHISWNWFIARCGRSSGTSLHYWLNCPLGCIDSI